MIFTNKNIYMKNKIFNFDKQDLFPVSLILIMVVSRLIPHPPNFTPIIAIAMMSGFFFKNLNFSLSSINLKAERDLYPRVLDFLKN